MNAESRPRGLQPDPDRAPIFVVGTARSGTTLLRLMLNAHPRIYLTHESCFYLSAGTQGQREGDSAWLTRYFSTFPFVWMRVDPDAVRAELPRRFAQKDAFLAVMRCKAREFGKVRFGDKTPFHSGKLESIFHDFPGARVIHIMRDPRAAVASLMRMPWAAGSALLNSFYCDKEVKQVRPFLDRIHDVRLEDLIEDPGRVLAGILAFVGEPWSDDVLDHTRKAPLNDIPPFPWLQGATRRVDARPNRPIWERQLGPAWIRIIEKMNRTGMQAYGYTPARLDREPGRRDKLQALCVDAPEALRFGLRMARFVQLSRQAASPGAEEMFARCMQFNPRAWSRYPGCQVTLRAPSPDGDPCGQPPGRCSTTGAGEPVDD